MSGKHHILLSGPTVATDEFLAGELEKTAVVLRNFDNSGIESIIGKQKVELILFEILKEKASELEIIKKIKIGFPNVEIVLIDGDGDRELLAEAFSYGIKDAFRKPYKCSLIIERVNALLEHHYALRDNGG